MNKINRYFNYPPINGYRCRFNGIRTCRYPYSLLNRVNYINNLNTFQLPLKKTSVIWVLLVITQLFKSVLRSFKRKWKWSGLLKQEALFLLNMMCFIYAFVKSKNFIYVFVESMIFVVIVMYEYYVLLKRKEKKRKCMWWTYVFKF